MKGSRAVVGKGFTRTTNGSEAVGPKGPAKAAEVPPYGETVKKGENGRRRSRAGRLFLPLFASFEARCPARRVTRLIFRDLVLLGLITRQRVEPATGGVRLSWEELSSLPKGNEFPEIASCGVRDWMPEERFRFLGGVQISVISPSKTEEWENFARWRQAVLITAAGLRGEQPLAPKKRDRGKSAKRIRNFGTSIGSDGRLRGSRHASLTFLYLCPLGGIRGLKKGGISSAVGMKGKKTRLGKILKRGAFRKKGSLRKEDLPGGNLRPCIEVDRFGTVADEGDPTV